MAEQTTFQTTAADWRDIGDQLFTGAMKAAALGDLRKAFISTFAEKEAAVAGVVFDVCVDLAIKLGEALHALEAPALPIIAGFVAPIVAGLFGAEVNEATFSRRLAKGGGAAAGQSIVDGLFRAIEGSAGTAISPGREGARRMAGAAVAASLESTFNAMVPELLSDIIPFDIGHFTAFTELPENIIRTLGISRLVRRAIGPLVDVACATPMQWDVNKTYRPNLLSTALAVRQFHRGKWTRAQLDEELARQGWSPERIDALVFDASQRFSDSELKAQRARNVIDDSQAVTRLQLNGWDEADARALVADWKVDRVYGYADRELSALASAYITRDLTPAEFSQAVGFLLPEATLAASFKSYAEHARTYNVKHLSHAEIRDAVTRGIVGFADYRRWLDREGYPPDEATVLELLLRTDISDQRELDKKRAETAAARAAEQQAAAVEKATKAAEIAARNARTFPSLSEIQRAVVRGLLDPSVYEQRLIDLKYAADDRTFLVALVEQEREDYLAAQQRKADAEAAKPDQAIGLPDLERAVVTGRASLDDYRRRLESDGYPAGDVALMVALLADQIRDRQTADAKRRAAEAALARKGLSLAQEEKAVRQGLRSLDQFRGFLTAQGFAAEDVALLAASLGQDIAEAEAAAQKRAAVNHTAQARGVSLAQLEQAVKLGVRSRDDYAAALVALGVSVDDQVTLLGILDRELADLAAARAKREQAPPAPAAPGLSRADLESAVRAGLASVETYRAFLREAGYAEADVDTLAGLLVLELQDAAQARTRRDQLDAENATRALARSDLERAVKAGVATMPQYAALLIQEGYAPADQQLLIDLLQHELDAKQTATARRAALVGELAAAGVDLDAIEAAVRDGAATIDDYVAALSDAGIKPVDVALLVQLLLESRARG